MGSVVEILFDYLRDAIYEPTNAVLNIETLPEDFKDFGSGLQYFTECVVSSKILAQALSKGDLTGELPPSSNEIAAPLKSLHATLKHLTWQAQQIAQGDYSQRVDFMGDFSVAFNAMVEQLAERERDLEDTIDQIQKKSNSLEQGNLLLNALMHYVPQQIIVMDRDTNEILLMNNAALIEINSDVDYINNLITSISSKRHELIDGSETDVTHRLGEEGERHFTVKLYLLEWGDSNAEVFVISDVSATRKRMKTLEIHAYHDSITQLYNRTFGMLTLDEWLNEKRQFVLIFADLNSLKYINDEFGHNEGDIYIMNAAKHLRTFSNEAVVCRIGGDEFMLLAENISYIEAHIKMKRIYDNFRCDEYLKDKKYIYSISYGIIAVDKNNKMSSGDILSIADERMYEDKRAKKRGRKN